MIEIALLDQVQQLVAKYPRLNLNTQKTTLLWSGDGSAAGSLAASAIAGKAIFSKTLTPDGSKLILAATNNAAVSPYKHLLFDTAAETLAFDDSVGRGFQGIASDATNVIWAAGAVAGYYGLWKRTGAATWTQVLTDSGAGTMYLTPDGNIHFRSSTGNYYLLSGGSASLEGAPSGRVSVEGYSKDTIGNFPCVAGSFDFRDIAGALVLNYPYDIYLNAGIFSTVAPSPRPWGCRIDATYSLSVQQVSATKACLFILNKTTPAVKFIGVIASPALPYGGGTVGGGSVQPFHARMANGLLQIYWIGNVGQGTTDGNSYGGVIRTDLSYTPDF